MKLNKTQTTEKAKLVQDLRTTAEALKEKIDAYDQAMQEQWQSVENAIAKYNEAVEAAESFRDTLASDLQSKFDDKSEKAQESEAGQALAEMISQWGEVFENIDISQPDEVDMPDFEVADNFENMPEET